MLYNSRFFLSFFFFIIFLYFTINGIFIIKDKYKKTGPRRYISGRKAVMLGILYVFFGLANITAMIISFFPND